MAIKKLLPLYLLDILKEHTDENHRLQLNEIVSLLKKEYDIECDRKTVRRTLTELLDFGCNIEYTETERANKDGEDNTIFTDWYLVHDFDDSELRILIDSLLFTKGIPAHQRKKLIAKLIGQSNRYFKASTQYICSMPSKQPENKQVLYTIEVISEAISKGRKVSFVYNDMGHDKKLHPRREERYIVNPYQIAAANGKYYLICNYDKYDNVANYRIDRITDIKIEDMPIKDKRLVKGMENGLTLSSHMAEHIYMFSGESVYVSFKAENSIVGEIIDWFGSDVRFDNIDEKYCTAYVKVNENAMFYWAMQYGQFIEILEPESLSNKIKSAVKCIAERYKGE